MQIFQVYTLRNDITHRNRQGLALVDLETTIFSISPWPDLCIQSESKQILAWFHIKYAPTMNGSIFSQSKRSELQSQIG